jgi:gluconokinase
MRPDVFSRVARWVSFGEFLVEQVTGEVTTSASMASGTGLLDVHTCDWDAEMLSAVGINRRHLSPIVPLRETARSNIDASARWPRLRGVAWLPAVADGASSSIGAGCTTPSHAAVMIGTSAAERVVWRPTQRFSIPWGAWCYRVDEHRAVVGGALNDGGNLFEWLRSTLKLPAVAAAEAQLATLEPDGHGLTVLPFWGGERSPGWSDNATGAVVGLRLHTTPVHILRACMEAVALRLGALDELLRPALGSDGALVATGGALLRSPTWMQIVADVMGRPLFASAEPEASSRGAALLALEALGVLKQPLEAMRPAVTRSFDPIAAHTERYRAAAERQRRQYDALVS